MKRLQCEMCGSQDLVKEGGVFVCQACGTKYSVEEAKKMMIEGVVSIDGTVTVEGAVKIDSSEELKKLYTLARRAKESDNIENACRYYTEIELKDPNSWEAYFYLIYFKARNAQIKDIPEVCKNISNSIPTLLDLMSKQVSSIEEQVDYLMSVSQDINMIGNIMMDSVRGVDFDIHDTIHYTADVLRMMDSVGQYFYETGEMLYNVATYIWKAAIDNFVQVYCYGKISYDHYKFFQKGALADYDLPGLVAKIYYIDLNYRDPMGFAEKLSRKEKYIICPQCGNKIREHSNKCPQCGCTEDEMLKIREETQRKAEEKRKKAESERLAKKAEETRIRKEKRQQWWKEKHKKFLTVLGCIFLAIMLLIGTNKWIQARNIAKADQLALTELQQGDECIPQYDFDGARTHYNNAAHYAKSAEVISSVNTHQTELKKQIVKAKQEYEANLKRLKILLEADDYQFNDYSNQCLDKMIQIAPQRNETKYYQNLRKQ